MKARPIDKLFEALSYMAKRPKLDEVLALINQINNVDVTVTDYHNRSLLHMAVSASLNEEEYNTISLALIKKGASVNTSGFSPLHYAAVQGSTRAMRFLIKNGASVNAKNEYGETPLHVAMNCRCRGSINAMIYCLIVNGADIHAKDRKGKAANENYQVADIVMRIEKIKVSNRANLPSLGLFAAKAIIDNNLSLDSLNADSINVLNAFESENMRKRFVGIGHS